MVAFVIFYIIGALIATVIVGLVCKNSPTIDDDDYS